MIGILITPLVVYVLLFLLPVFYDEIPQRKAGLVAGILYTLFPLPSSFYFTFVSVAVVNTLGIDKHIPNPLNLLAVIFLASLMATLMASLPFLLIRKKREIKRPVLLIFLATFCIDLVLVGVFGWLSAV